MPAKKSKLFEFAEFFRTAPIEQAKETLAFCREVVRGREPKARRTKTKAAPRPNNDFKDSVMGE